MATSVVVAELGYNLISYNKCPNGSQCDENVTETYFIYWRSGRPGGEFSTRKVETY